VKDFSIIDTTLRDGEQTAGVSFSQGEKISIAKELDKAGVDIIEVGIPVMGEMEKKRIEKILALDLEAEILTWNRMKQEDIEASLACGARNVHISAPASEVHIEKKLDKSKNWLLRRLRKIITYAHQQGLTVSVGAEDASRADFDFLVELFKVAENAGVKRVRYADTVGALSPLEAQEKIAKLRTYLDLEIDFHGHNDFGMATANAVSAYKAGAKYISCTVNGLGERAGNTALEEVVMALMHLEQSRNNVKVNKLQKLSEVVAQAADRKIPEDKPIVGSNIFSHESGIHVDGLVKDTETYEAFAPEILGREREFVLGKFSGIKAVIQKYQELGIELDEEQAAAILQKIKKE
jgi:homocitrate synthase NifV